jgi:hypothetical protein
MMRFTSAAVAILTATLCAVVPAQVPDHGDPEYRHRRSYHRDREPTFREPSANEHRGAPSDHGSTPGHFVRAANCRNATASDSPATPSDLEPKPDLVVAAPARNVAEAARSRHRLREHQLSLE